MNKKWDAEVYRKNSTRQTQIAFSILDAMVFKGDEAVLDIGCGEGRITSYIASDLVHRGNVLGIDPSPSMISLAKKSFPKTEYKNLDFQQLPVEKLNFRKKFNVIVSFSALHWVKDQLLALKNIYRALVPKGRLVILIFPRAEHIWGPMERVSETKKWKHYFKNFQQPHQFYDIDGYRILVRQSGLIIDSIQIKSSMYKFPSKEDYINILRSFAPYHEQVPADKRELFLKDVAADFEKMTTKDEAGNLLCPIRRLEVLAHRGLRYERI